jgi:hypothetical protein
MKAVRELRIRFEPLGPLRPRVFWRRCLRDSTRSPPGEGESPTLQIELKNGSILITSVDERRVNEESGASGTWEEVFDTRAAWTGGARVAVDFGDEFPDGTRTLIGIGLAPDAPAPAEPRAEVGTLTRFFNIETRAVGESRGRGAGSAISLEETQVIRRPVLATIESVVRGYGKRVKRAARTTRLTPPRVAFFALLLVCLLALLVARLRIFGRGQGSAAAATRPAPASTMTAPTLARAAKTAERSADLKQTSAPADAIPEIAAAPPSLSANRGEKTLERRAADAIATGAFSDAVPLYDELARQHPDSPIYREAARIVRSQRPPSGRTAQADAR